MKKNYLKGFALLIGLTLSANALAENAGMMTKAVYSYGAMYEGGFSPTPTGVVRSFYDVNNRLVRKVEADIMLADSEGTAEVEVPGQEIPKLYSIYEYDANGALLKVRNRKYGLYSGYDRAWADFTDAEVYEYDTNGKLVKKTDATYITSYVWEGDNLVEETAHYTKDGKWSNTIKYTAFAEGKTNVPVSALFSDKWKNTSVYEYVYDDAGNKVAFNEYKVQNPEKDENGVLVKGDKGTLNKLTNWKYVDGILVEELNGAWNNGMEKIDTLSKIDYAVNGDTTTISSYMYNKGRWNVYGGPKKSVVGVVDNATSATELTVTDVKDALNTVLLTAKAPEGASAEGWNVYRNGMLIGEATLADGVLSYQDSLVDNGTWDYFVQQGDGNISEVVEKSFNTTLATVEGIVCRKNSLNATGDYELVIAWTKPNIDMEVLGYNVYMDIVEYETNPAPQNEKVLLTEGTFTYTQPVKYTADEEGTVVTSDPNHVFYIEVVYPIGKARSQAFPIVLQQEEHPLQTKVIMTIGDAMGNTSDNAASKAEVFYYDADNKVVRKMIYGKLLGSDESDPDQLYGAGDWIPMTYTAYDYNEKGQLVNTRERQYGVFSGYNKAWNEFEETGSFSYDAQGRILEDTVTNRVYHYTYEGDNIVKETYANSRDVIIYHKYYSNFAEGLVNCPQYAFANSPYGLTTNDRIYEYSYDEKGRMVKCYAYKYSNETITKDDEGNAISAEKGTPDYEEIWTYDNDILVQYEKNVWKSAKNAYEGKNRIEYTLTPMGTKAVTWTYSVGIWAKGGTPQVTWDVPFDGVAASDLTIEEVDGVNTVKLTAKKPAGALATTVWNVFRNGSKIGQAASLGRNDIVYVDTLVSNGNWDYFIQAEDPHGPMGVNVSNVVEKTIYTELPPVTDIKVVRNGYNDVQDYEVLLDWEAPTTDLTIKGYNMFVDVKAITKNPSPVNGIYTFPETEYLYTVGNDVPDKNKTFMVEAVYNIGKVKSEAVAIVLGADGIEGVTVDDLLMLVGKTLYVNGEYLALEIYLMNGVQVGNYSGMNQIDLSALATGVYAIRVNTVDGVLTGKVAIK